MGGRCRPEGEDVGRARFWVVVVNPQAPPAPAPRRASPFFPLFLKMPREVRPLLTCRPWVRGRRCNERLCNERLLPMILFHEKDMGMHPPRPAQAGARAPSLSPTSHRRHRFYASHSSSYFYHVTLSQHQKGGGNARVAGHAAPPLPSHNDAFHFSQQQQTPRALHVTLHPRMFLQYVYISQGRSLLSSLSLSLHGGF